jgi:DHA2 family multidrug resistance protein-like MFS transporter
MISITTAESHPQRWWIAFAILIGTWTGTSTNTMMPVALPSMLDDFKVGVDVGVWVISIFVLLAAIFMPISGWLGDRYGYRRIYITGFVGLWLFSWAAVLSTTFRWLLVTRALQGIFDAVGLPSTLGIISLTFSRKERGLAMGVWAAVNGASHGLGPAISGFLVQRFGWAAPFWLNGATALLTVILLVIIVPADQKRQARPFDLLGASALTLAMLTLMFNLRQGSALGWTSTVSLSLWVVFGVLLLLFVLTERRVAQPFVQLQLFTNKHYSLITAVSCGQFAVLASLQLLLSLYLIQLRGLAEGLAGVIILPLASTLAIFSPVAGRITDKIGLRSSMMIGLGVTALMVGSMSSWHTSTPTWLVMTTLTLTGLGMGFAHSQGAAGVSLVIQKSELGVALGIYSMLRFISATFGVNTLGLIVETGRTRAASLLSPYQTSFIVLTVVAAISFLLATLIPKSELLAIGLTKPGFCNTLSNSAQK